MPSLVPPSIPTAAGTGDDDRLRRVRLRQMQILATAVTLSVTVWVCTLGVVPAIVALVTAKHVLVAIFLMGTRMATREC